MIIDLTQDVVKKPAKNQLSKPKKVKPQKTIDVDTKPISIKSANIDNLKGNLLLLILMNSYFNRI